MVSVNVQYIIITVSFLSYYNAKWIVAYITQQCKYFAKNLNCFFFFFFFLQWNWVTWNFQREWIGVNPHSKEMQPHNYHTLLQPCILTSLQHTSAFTSIAFCTPGNLWCSLVKVCTHSDMIWLSQPQAFSFCFTLFLFLSSVQLPKLTQENLRWSWADTYIATIDSLTSFKSSWPVTACLSRLKTSYLATLPEMQPPKTFSKPNNTEYTATRGSTTLNMYGYLLSFSH